VPDDPGYWQVEFVDPNVGWTVPPPVSPPEPPPVLPPVLPPGGPARSRVLLVGVLVAALAVVGIVVALGTDGNSSTPVAAPSAPTTDFPTVPSGLPSGFSSGLPSGPVGTGPGDDAAVIELNVAIFSEGIELPSLTLVNTVTCDSHQLTQPDLDAFGDVTGAAETGAAQVSGHTATAQLLVKSATSSRTYTVSLEDPQQDSLSWCIDGVS
jgi:hypothetical protein